MTEWNYMVRILATAIHRAEKQETLVCDKC